MVDYPPNISNPKKMKMIGETIRTEFEALKNDFETIRQQIEDDVVRTELYKGEFYELTPYSYQRNGCKQGKPVKRPDTIKSTKIFVSTDLITKIKS